MKAINEQTTKINGMNTTARIRRKGDRAIRQIIPSTVKKNGMILNKSFDFLDLSHCTIVLKPFHLYVKALVQFFMLRGNHILISRTI